MLALLAASLLLASDPQPVNFLVLVADDVGVDRIAAYGEHPDPGKTPNIDRLAQRGVLFRNFWAYPLCSSARAAFLTGRYGFRTGIGRSIWSSPPHLPDLSLAEVTLPEVLRRTPVPYTSVALGKWHLGAFPKAPGHPQASGFDHHAGSLHNLKTGPRTGYTNWIKSTDGAIETTSKYATTDTADDAVRAIKTLAEPWFLWVSFNAAHKPLHAPPADLHSFELKGRPNDTPVEHVKAMVEAMDAEIGRVLAALDPGLADRTTVIFLGDNGTLGAAIEPPSRSDRGKGTLYEGGLNVPLIVQGAAVRQPGRECAALVDATDLFATLAELAGVDPREALPPGVVLDSVSFAPQLRAPDQASAREFAFAERFQPNGPGPYEFHNRAVRGPRYKLIRRRPGGDELYDLKSDPSEQTDLLKGELSGAQRAAYEVLASRLEGLLAPADRASGKP